MSSVSSRFGPAWVRDTVVCERYPRALSAAGTFASVTERLGELKELGADSLWLMPIHPIGEKLRKGTPGSPYAVRDSYGANPEFETPADLKRLVTAAPVQGLKVILDAGLNHTRVG